MSRCAIFAAAPDRYGRAIVYAYRDPGTTAPPPFVNGSRITFNDPILSTVTFADMLA